MVATSEAGIGGTDPRAAPTSKPRAEALATDKPPRRNDPVPQPLPFLLDFYPQEDPKFTRIAAFFDGLRKGWLTTTKCDADGTLSWPPRVACPTCRGEKLTWVELPRRGKLYAFSAVLGGAPLGMEQDVPFVVGLIDLEGSPLRIFSRIANVRYEDCCIGMEVVLETFDLPDGRIFYRFRPPA
ncbi:MAG: Zn-ribbon domain-containing OB-fold protein [Euryarchaeota archaeon]|nr:Zn-ribbon domain-containing OB-fold protein [Euryarchaeota archaeon]MDE1835690.1 Zn-ribbon domain-containing OB-fold protein [Euryarchaeota archaeon]MDE1880448.1 Zn-ribbon domain-containing OB-fold protein [Euryarchaeota archaeon]MDE2043880.1 Zn-ribbon domain-containing OB-fold protein [Thermoplasmata archaeon]